VELRGSQILVTGASSGIGAALARELARRGAILTLVARSREGLEAVAAEIEREGGAAHVEPADLGQVEAVEALAARVLERSGPPDVLINNAGAGRWLAI
jgi:short-subunit dehydrogenase